VHQVTRSAFISTLQACRNGSLDKMLCFARVPPKRAVCSPIWGKTAAGLLHSNQVEPTHVEAKQKVQMDW